jgi:hypothetical protein
VANCFLFYFWHTSAEIWGVNWMSGLLKCLWEPLLLFYGRFLLFWKVTSDEPWIFPSMNVTDAVSKLKFELNELLPPFAHLTLTKDCKRNIFLNARFQEFGRCFNTRGCL